MCQPYSSSNPEEFLTQGVGCNRSRISPFNITITTVIISCVCVSHDSRTQSPAAARTHCRTAAPSSRQRQQRAATRAAQMTTVALWLILETKVPMGQGSEPVDRHETRLRQQPLSPPLPAQRDQCGAVGLEPGQCLMVWD